MDPEHLRELFSAFRPVDVRRMFSGAGIFADGLMFALVVDEVVYLKAGDDNAADFDRANLPPFQYRRKGDNQAVMSYRRMPDRLYDDPEELAHWAAKALRVASRKAKRTVKSTARPTPKSVRKKPKRG